MKIRTVFFIGILVVVNQLHGQQVNTINNLDKPPCFHGGNELLDDYFRIHLKQPKQGSNIDGSALLSFKVDTLGGISDVRVIRSLYQSFEDDIIPIVLTMPNWIPGEIKGIKVEAIVYLSIKIWN